MSDIEKEIDSDERAALGAIADDSLKIFRSGLFVIVLYVSILSLTLREGGVSYIENIIASSYTMFGIIFWVGSVASSVLTYRMARRITLQDSYSQLGVIDDKFEILNFATASTVGLLVSVFSLIFGLLDGWANTLNDSPVGLGIEQPVIIIFLSSVFVLSIYSLLSVLDMARNRWGSVREMLRLSSRE